MPLSKQDETRRAKRPIVVSQGEPSGIGPEVAVKAWSLLKGSVRGRPIQLIGSADVFRKAPGYSEADAQGLNAAIHDIGGAVRAEPGRASPENAKSVTGAIECAVEACRR